MGEVIALKEQSLAAVSGQGVGEAVAEIGPRRMTAALAEVPIRLTGTRAYLGVTGSIAIRAAAIRSSSRPPSTGSRFASTTMHNSKEVPADAFLHR